MRKADEKDSAMPKQELILNTTFRIILEAYMYTKKHGELRYWEFAMKMQNGARKAAVEDTAIFMATQFITIIFMYQKHRRKGYLSG